MCCLWESGNLQAVVPRRGKSFKVSLSSLPASSEQQVLEEKGTVPLRHLPTLLRGGWRAPIYSLAPPCLSGGKGTGFIGSLQTTENPVTRFPPGRERATKWRGGIVKGTLLEAASRNETPYGDSRRRRPIKTIAAQRQSTTFSREAAVKPENLPPFFESSRPREALIKSLFAFILEFLCNARNGTTRIASYLRSPMTKQCIKILIKADSAN